MGGIQKTGEIDQTPSPQMNPLPLCSCILAVSESSNCLVANAVVSPPVDYNQDEKRFLWQDSIVGENKLNYEYPSPLKSSVAVGG